MSDTQTVEAPGGVFSEQQAVADGFTIRYYEAGEGEAVVHIPGARGPQFSFALDRLAAGFRVLIVELPGLGESELNDRTQSSAEMAATLAEFIRELKIAPAKVWGTSMGGIVATRLTLDHPDVVDSLALEAPPAFRGEDARPLSELTPEELSSALNSHPERVAYKQRAELDPARRELMMRLVGPAYDTELERQLSRIELPTLVFFGVNDGVTPPHCGRIYKREIAQCSYVLVHDAAHDVQGDRPEACADLVGDFFRRGAQFVVNQQDSRINP